MSRQAKAASLLVVILFVVAAVRAEDPGVAAEGNSATSQPASKAVTPTLLDVQKIWDGGPHNAFTDLIRFDGRWVCAFRESSGHVAKDGHLRVITSSDGRSWSSVADLVDARGDLRDAKLSILPDGGLMLLTATNLRDGGGERQAYQSVAFITRDLKQWEGPTDVGEPDVWLWGLRWHNGVGLSIGYGTAGAGRFARLYQTADGTTFKSVVEKLPVDVPYPNESAITFDDNGNATVLLRCDPDAAYVGQAAPPYAQWNMRRSKVRVGGPALIRLPSGRLLGCGRLHDGSVRTSLFWVDAASGAIEECLRLPSGGDTSYAGLAWHEGVLHVSYYSTHEGKTCIYFARVAVPGESK